MLNAHGWTVMATVARSMVEINDRRCQLSMHNSFVYIHIKTHIHIHRPSIRIIYSVPRWSVPNTATSVVTCNRAHIVSAEQQFILQTLDNIYIYIYIYIYTMEKSGAATAAAAAAAAQFSAVFYHGGCMVCAAPRRTATRERLADRVTSPQQFTPQRFPA